MFFTSYNHEQNIWQKGATFANSNQKYRFWACQSLSRLWYLGWMLQNCRRCIWKKKTHEKRTCKSHVFYAFSARIDGSKKFYFNNFVQFLSWFKLLFLTFKLLTFFNPLIPTKKEIVFLTCSANILFAEGS